MRSTGDALGARFESSPNALNALRLLLAVSVILWHAYAHSLRPAPIPWPIAQLGGQLGVDAFFAISGFLIARSVMRQHIGRYATARAIRLLPGLWGCLLVTAFGIAPLTAWITDGPWPTPLGQLRYVLFNAATWVGSPGIDGGPIGVQLAGSWNLSLWTLAWEAGCYAVVALLAVLGLLTLRVVGGVALLLWIVAAGFLVSGLPQGNMGIFAPSRLGLMFACGVLLWLMRERVPLDWRLAVVGAALLALGSLTPNYRLVAAPAIAYLCFFVALKAGACRFLVVRNDLSYGTYVYGGAVQQALFALGLGSTWWLMAATSLLTVLPLAAVSWFLIERPALRWRAQAFRGRRSVGRPSVSNSDIPTNPWNPPAEDVLLLRHSN